MKEKQKLVISNSEIYYYKCYIEVLILNLFDEDEFFEQKVYEVEEFYQALKETINELIDNNIYPVEKIEWLKQFILKIQNRLKENSNNYYRYSILYTSLEITEFKDSFEYLECEKLKKYSTLKDRFSCIYQTKEQLEEEIKLDFIYLNLLINKKLSKQNRDILCDRKLVSFFKNLLLTIPDILNDKSIKEELLTCLQHNFIDVNYDETKRDIYEESLKLHYQITNRSFNLLKNKSQNDASSSTLSKCHNDYPYLNRYSLFVKINLELLKQNPESLEKVFSKNMCYSLEFLYQVSLVIDKLLLDKNLDFGLLYEYQRIKSQIGDYLNDYYFEALKQDNKKEIVEKINNAKIKLNGLTPNNIYGYYANDFTIGTFFFKDVFEARKKDLTNLFQNNLENDYKLIKALIAPYSVFDEEKEDLISNPYLLSCINKNIKIFDDMLFDTLIFDRINELLDSVKKYATKENKYEKKIKMIKRRIQLYNAQVEHD